MYHIKLRDKSVPGEATSEQSAPCDMEATLVLEVPGAGQAFMPLCGYFWPKAFTLAAARRSLLPSLSTGFTADPRIYIQRRTRRAGEERTPGNAQLSIFPTAA